MAHIDREGIQKALLAWFDSNARSLPWRTRRSLYGTWISETMLQQTTVAAVIPFWERFMDRFPDVTTLAGADEADVLACWSGLGYYRRAKNLHAAAVIIIHELAGKMPSDRKQWHSLPGIGSYASGAIASIGLGEAVPAVDGNARRVLCRWFFDEPDPAASLKPRVLEEMAGAMVVPGRAGEWNEAVMELGATLCRAKSPQCGSCPMLDHCRAGLAGHAEGIPPAKAREQTIAIAMAALVVRGGGRVLMHPPGSLEKVLLSDRLELGRNDTSGLHQGLWTLPVTPWYLECSAVNQILGQERFVRDWIEDNSHRLGGFTRVVITPGKRFTHCITRYRLKVRVWEIELLDARMAPPKSPSPEPFVPKDNFSTPTTDNVGYWFKLTNQLPVSKLMKKSLGRA